ncbi:MAG: hypothetical protein ABL857_08945 [Rickettsiales bacterium]
MIKSAKSETRNMTKIHLCSDFDLTITNFHTGGEYQVLAREDLKNPDLLLQTFRKAIAEHYLSIVTFGESEAMVRETLKLISLTEEEVAKVVVVTGLAEDKVGHIKEAYRRHGLLGEDDNLKVRFPIRTLLLEDDINNATSAAKGGACVLLSSDIEDCSHIESALKILTNPSTIDQECFNHARVNNYRANLEQAGVILKAA